MACQLERPGRVCWGSCRCNPESWGRGRRVGVWVSVFAASMHLPLVACHSSTTVYVLVYASYADSGLAVSAPLK